MATPSNFIPSFPNLSQPSSPASPNSGVEDRRSGNDEARWRELERWGRNLPFPRIQRVLNEFTPVILEPTDSLTVNLYPDDTDGFFAGEHGVYTVDLSIRYRQATDESQNFLSISANFDIMESIGFDIFTWSAGTYIPVIKGYKDFPYADEVFAPTVTLRNESAGGTPSDSDLDIRNVSCIWTFWASGLTNTLTRRSFDQGFPA